MQYLFRISDYGLVKSYSVLVLHHDRKTLIEFQVTSLKVKVIMTHKQTNIIGAIAMNAFNTKTSYFIFQTKRGRRGGGLHVKLWVKRSKVNLPETF